LKVHDKSEIVRNRRDYEIVTKDLGVLEKTIAEKEQTIRELEAKASEISKESGPEMQRLNREVQLCEDLIKIFTQAVTRLRDDLRKSVEQDATDIFLHLITDKSYKGLRINENYGLTILDAQNREVQVRSAGAEQVVALSLIGALNRNAVRQGPIIMDTPFGRLDTKHRENILKFIPTMAEQVTLLIHDGEIDRDRDLKIIQDKIDKEYIINHQSSHCSELIIMDMVSIS
jgi:DNA sulfur modification protein DndD